MKIYCTAPPWIGGPCPLPGKPPAPLPLWPLEPIIEYTVKQQICIMTNPNWKAS